MYVFEFKWWIIIAALQNKVTNQIHLKNKFIGHDLLISNGRKFNNFDYKYNDWEDKEAQNVLLDYNLDVTLRDDNNQLHNYDIPHWNHDGTTRNHTQTKTTPMIFVTITTSKAPESITTIESTTVDTTLNEATAPASQTTLNAATLTASRASLPGLNEATFTGSQTTLNAAPITASLKTSNAATVTTSQMNLNEATVTVTETSLKVATISETTPSFSKTQTFIDDKLTTEMTVPGEETELPMNVTDLHPPPPVTPSSAEEEEAIPKPSETLANPATATLTTLSNTEILMTYPKSFPTEPELNTFSYIMPTDWSVHYPPDMTIPKFGESPTEPNPILTMFTRNMTTLSTTEGDIVKEAHDDMKEKQAGYLTTFLIKVSKVIAMKNKTDASKLFRALEHAVDNLEYHKQLSGFGKSTVAWFQTVVRTMTGVPTDVIQSQATLMYYLLTNRRVAISPDIVNLLDLVDNIYLKVEGEAILKVLQDIKDYPATTKSSADIAVEMMNDVVMNPFKRIYGTPQEKYLVQRIEELIVNKYLHGVGIQRRKGTPVFIRYSKTKKIRTPPPPLIQTKSTKRTTISNKYAKFSKNLTIKRGFHHRLWVYKDRRKPGRWKQWRSRRTTTEGTTEKSTRVVRTLKSNYVIRKYVKKNLKRRTIRTTTTEVIPQKRIHLNKSKEMKSKKVAKKLTKKTKVTKLKVKETRNYEHKKINSIEASKISSDHVIKKQLVKRGKKGLKMRRFETAKYINEQSSFTDEEEMLKANLYDAFFHNYEPVFRAENSQFEGHFRAKNNREISSYTDEETVIKSKIYKAFGYENDFAKTVKKGRLN